MNRIDRKRKAFVWSAVLVIANAVLLVLLTLAGSHMSTDRDGVGTLMKQLDVVRQIYVDKISGSQSGTPAELASEFFPVNIGYDREMVTAFDEFGIPVGTRPVVSRERLARFLEAIRGADYKSIVVDVQFFKSDTTEADSTFFAIVNSMPRTFVSANDDDDAEDSISPDKLASSEYNVSLGEDNFVKYRYEHGDVRDMAVATYNLRNNSDVDLGSFFSTDHGRLALSKLALWMPYRIESGYDANDEKTYYNLGADLLDVYTPEELSGLVSGKTVVIGDYSGGDDHDTYTGSVAGPVILINAVIALEQRRHIVNWWWMGLFFIVYLLLTLMMIYDPARLLPGKLGKSKIGNLIVTGLSFGTVILALNIIMYLCSGVIYDLFLPTLWLTVRYFIKDHSETIKRYLRNAVGYIRNCLNLIRKFLL